MSQLERKGQHAAWHRSHKFKWAKPLGHHFPYQGRLEKDPHSSVLAQGKRWPTGPELAAVKSVTALREDPTRPKKGATELLLLCSSTSWFSARLCTQASTGPLQTFTATVPPAIRCAGLRFLVHVHSIKQGVGPRRRPSVERRRSIGASETRHHPSELWSSAKVGGHGRHSHMHRVRR